jgi:hypothetical protein
MFIEEPQYDVASKMEALNASLLAAISESAYHRLPALLESQRIAVDQINWGANDEARREMERGLREALLLATVKSIHLNELVEACRRRSNTIVAYRCEPVGPLLFSSCG